MADVLVFQHVRDEPPGLIGTVLAERGHRLDIWRTKHRDLPLRLPGDIRALVVMGGPQAVYERERNPWLDAEVELTRQAIERGLPVLGVCLGSQIIAVAAGARVFSGTNGREIGWDQIALTPEGSADPLCSHLGESENSASDCSIFQWHGDTFDLPPGAVRLATSARYENQAFRLGANAYAFQFHFEVDAEMIATWVERGEEYVREGGFVPEPILAGRERYLASMTRRGRGLVQAFAALIEARNDAAIVAVAALPRAPSAR